MTKRPPKIPSLDLDDTSLIRFLRVCVERALARNSDDPKALETLAWLNRRRKADPRTYAGRKLPESLTRLLQR